MINQLSEYATVLIALLIQGIFLAVRKNNLRTIILILLLSVPVLLLSTESMNSILTCDESYIVYEPLNIFCDTLFQWEYGAFRTTDLLIGIPLTAFKAITGFTFDIMAIIIKSAHWLMTFIVILFFIIMLIRLIDSTLPFTIQYMILLYSIMLLPVVFLAIKTINYDSLSMFLSAFSLIMTAYGIKFRKKNLLYCAVIIAALAVQEKLIAAPLMWVVMIVCSISPIILESPGSLKDALIKTEISVIKTVLLPIAVFFCAFIVLGLFRGGHYPNSGIANVFLPLFIGFWPVLRLFNLSFMNSYTVFNPLYSFLFIITAITVFSIAGMSVVCIYYKIMIKMSIRKLILILNNWLFLLVLLIGVIATYTVNTYLGPYFPVSEGYYKPNILFNSSFIHHGARHILGHQFLTIAWAYSIFVNAFPTSILFFALIFTVYRICKRFTPVNLHPLKEFTVAVALLAPLLYSILQIPIANRYLNLFLLLFLIGIVIDLINVLSIFSKRKALCFSVIFCMAILFEVIPFRPLYGSFRPIWSEYNNAYKNSPSPGILNPSWMGWGEEIALAGKKILSKGKMNGNPLLNDVRIYHNYYGEWLYKKNNADLIFMDSLSEYRYTENDYYVLNRMGITQSILPFPGNVKPYFTIDFRGFTQAWVFRGDDLSKKDFRF